MSSAKPKPDDDSEPSLEKEDPAREQRKIRKIAEAVSRKQIKQYLAEGDISAKVDEGRRVTLSKLEESGFSRRTALGILFFLTVGFSWGGAVQRAQAAASGESGATGSPLLRVYTQEINGDGSAISVVGGLSFSGLNNTQLIQNVNGDRDLLVTVDQDFRVESAASGNEHFAVRSGGPVQILNADLSLSNKLDNSNALSTGSTIHTKRGVVDSNHQSGDFIKWTDGVGTSATSILDMTSFDGGDFGALVVVYGRDTSGGGRFTDLLVFAFNGSPSKIGGVGANSPASRTYTQGANNSEINLAMGAGSYDVAARAFGLWAN